MSNPLRSLPAVHDLLGSPAFSRVLEAYPRDTVGEAVRGKLDQIREDLKSGKEANGQIDAQHLARQIQEQLSAETKPHLRQVINATGVLLHTNIGRAPMARSAAEAADQAA